MEYLEGHDLNQILRHHGPQMPQAVVDLILQACEGMAEAHAMGIIHRDIKPSNFFITRRPDGSNLLKILDFGISKTPAELSELTGAQTVIGTPTYMAPEQMVSAKSTDPRSDIWSMGVVMYQLLAGRPPFEAETYAQLVLKVGTESPAPLHQVALPPGLQEIVLRCLEKKPENRIQSVGELARMLAPYASDPMSAQQSAERSSRILTTPRGAQPGFPLAGSSSGGLMMPPPALTPKSWHSTNGSSLSGGAGQIGTKVVRKGRGLVIAGVATMCILAGVGGFVIASSMSSKSTRSAAKQETVQRVPMPSTAATPPPAVTTPTPATTSVPTPSTATAVATPSVKTDVAKTAATKTDGAKTDAAKSAAVKTATTKTDATKTDGAKTDGAKTDAAKTTAVKTDAAKTNAAKSTETKTDTTNSDATKSDATKAVAKPTATKTAKITKSTATKSKSKSTKSTKTTKAKADDDLFDDRR
jgi:serine/threonine-protein kinase